MHALSGKIRVDFRSPEPAYTQIAHQVEELVRQGALQPGDQLPTVRELAIDLRINFSTVARAYKLLDERRLISTQRGRGTYIEEADGSASAEAAREHAPPPSRDALLAAARRALDETRRLGFTKDDLIEAIQNASQSTN